jgi:hypothetical protein
MLKELGNERQKFGSEEGRLTGRFWEAVERR